MWDHRAQSYSQLTDRRSAPLLLQLLNMVRLEQCDKIIEIGCGTSFLLPHMLQRKKTTAQLQVTDLSEQMLSYTQQRVERMISNPLQNLYDSKEAPKPFGSQAVVFDKLNLTISQVNSMDLSKFQNDSFDCYISNLVMLYAADPAAMCKEAYRVL